MAKKATIPAGQATAHYCREKKIALGGKAMKEAWTIAQSRGNRMVWLEDLFSALGLDPTTAKKDRARLARVRRNDRIAAVAAAKEAVAAKRRAKREAKEAATA